MLQKLVNWKERKKLFYIFRDSAIKTQQKLNSFISFHQLTGNVVSEPDSRKCYETVVCPLQESPLVGEHEDGGGQQHQNKEPRHEEEEPRHQIPPQVIAVLVDQHLGLLVGLVVGAAEKFEEQHVDGKSDDTVEDADQLAKDCLWGHVPIACKNEELGKKIDMGKLVFYLSYSCSCKAGNVHNV